MNQTLNEIQVSYSTPQTTKPQIKSSLQVYEMVKKHWNPDHLELHEEFKVIFLNKGNRVLGIYDLTKGGISQCTVDVRLIFSIALKVNSSGIMLVHNHPSGNLTPSAPDTAITKNIREIGVLMNIKLLDHLIITKENYYSFADHGDL